MDARWRDRLSRMARENDWVKGAVNYDEDLHFSTFYLRASCASRAAPLYPGYSVTVAFYEGFNETYYLLKEECRTTAAAVVRKALRRPGWLPGVLREIRRRSDALESVFSPNVSPEWLRRLPHERVLALYRRHALRQRALYRVARLPEALDRGVNYFSDYLKGHLRGLGLSPAEAERAFATCAQPVVPSVLAQELLEFDAVVRDVRSRRPAHEPAARSPGKARLFLDAGVLQRLDAHRLKWHFLAYHGYGKRERTSLGEYLDRLLARLDAPETAGPDQLLRRCADALAARRRLLDALPLDAGHRALFELYPEIGAVKLYRRSAQLRNFYGLDLLLAEIARRLGVAEWLVRCLRPEELEASLAARRLAVPTVHQRTPGCLYLLLDDEEHVFGGPAVREFAGLFEARVRRRSGGAELRGVVASQGKAAGPCKVVIRADDVRGEFAPGTILVSESTDPDLTELMRRAGAVLTEQGGVTSHAAVICRELGVPAVIGVEGLLDRVRDGDRLEVDAYRGVVSVVPEAAAPEATLVHADGPPEVVGAKAHNLARVRSFGSRTPEFVVLDYDAARELLHTRDGAGARRLAEQVMARVGLSAAERLAIRSSSLQEDRTDGSRAGDFHSLLRVHPGRFVASLRKFVEINRVGRSGLPYRGSIILQRMIEADFAGVCLTRDGRTGRDHALILELTPGGNEAITGGSAVPDRLVVDRLTGDILEAERRGAEPPPGALDLSALVREFLTLEARFGAPLDIEWAVAGRELYILQARPIVDGRAGGPSLKRPGRNGASRPH